MADLRATSYGERMADDVFLTGTSRTKRAEAEAEAQRRGVKSVGQVVHHDTRRVIVDDLPVMVIETVEDGVTDWRVEVHGNPYTPEQMVESGFDVRILTPAQVVLREYMAGLGEGILRIIDAIEVHGDMTRAELVEMTGKTKSAIARATLRAERDLGLLCSYQDNKKAPKVYALNPDWAESLAALRPALRTHKLGVERRVRNEEELIAFCDRESAQKGVDEARRRNLAKRRGRSERRLAELVPQLNDGIDAARWAATPNTSNARFDHSPTDRAKRQERIEANAGRFFALMDTLQDGGALSATEIAVIRTAAGQLGVDIAPYAVMLSEASKAAREREEQQRRDMAAAISHKWRVKSDLRNSGFGHLATYASAAD